MTKEEARAEFERLLQEKVKEEGEVIAAAKKAGQWNSGLDCNLDLLNEVNEKYSKLFAELDAKMQEG